MPEMGHPGPRAQVSGAATIPLAPDAPARCRHRGFVPKAAISPVAETPGAYPHGRLHCELSPKLRGPACYRLAVHRGTTAAEGIRMRRRELITLLGAAAAWPLAAHAQQIGKLPRIGVLVSASPPHPFADAFWQGLHALGYSEGQNITVEFRYTEGRSDRAAELAGELVRLKVDVIVAHFTPAVRAAMGATQMIPIVMAPAGAPLQTGFVSSLAHPGGNVTGLSAMGAELGGKRLQLLRDLIPSLACV